jgi:hypothetical protein
MALLETKRYRIEPHDQRIDVEWDRSLVFVGRLRLLIDGRRVDQSNIFYGETRL